MSDGTVSDPSQQHADGPYRVVSEWLESRDLSRIVSYVARRKGLMAEDASDLLQDVFLALLRAGTSRPINSAWILCVTLRRAEVLRRSRYGELRIENPDLYAKRESTDPVLRHLLKARVSGLPTRLHQFFTLRFDQGLSQRETAAELHTSRSSVRWMEGTCLQSLGML